MYVRSWSWIPVTALLLSVLAAPAAEAPSRVTVSGDAVQVQLSFSPPVFRSVADGVVPEIDGLPTFAAAPGHPRLPVSTFTLVLPPGTAVRDLEIDGAPSALPGAFRLAWGWEPRPVGTPPGGATDPDVAIYGSDDLYPADPVTITGTGFFRGYQLVSLAVRPLQVRSRSGQVQAWPEMELRLGLAPATTGMPAASGPRGLVEDLEALAHVAVNPETGFSYGAPEKDRSADSPYLIVTTEALRPTFQRLLEHRLVQGTSGEILTMEWIESHHAGRDAAERLRAAITQAYHDHGTTFVLLGGDDADDADQSLVPVRHCPQSDNTPSDYYFGALDGDWDGDGDGVFCEANEVDYYSEVHIGRATVDTPEEADHWIDKVIAYESGLLEEQRRDLVFMGEKLDASTYGDDAMEQTAGIVPEDEYAIERLYARWETFNLANIIYSLNRGPHLTNHLGHSSWNHVMGLGIGDVEALVNPSPFFSYSQGCYAGAFDQGVSGNTEAISEHFLTTEHGAFGVVMNGRYGWYYVGSPYGLSQGFAHEFHDALLTEGLHTLGEANDDARADNAASAQTNGTWRYCFLETNLHGDPATPVQMRKTQLRYAAHRVVDEDPAYGNCNGVADPAETVEIAVTLANDGDGTATAVGARLISSTAGVTVHDPWTTWEDIPPGQERENLPAPFRVTLDRACGDQAAFRLEVHHGGGLVDVGLFNLVVGSVTDQELLHDDFEEDNGWTTGGDAQTGQFVREDPHEVVDGVVGTVQAGDDFTTDGGTACWVTGNPVVGPGFDPRSADVDSGTTFIESPVFDGSGGDGLLARFARWFHRTGVAMLNSGYYLARVSNDGGATWHDLERLDANVPTWMVREIDLAAAVAPTDEMVLRFEAVEGPRRQPGDPLIELLVDEVQVFRREVDCGTFLPGESMPPNPVGNTLLVERAGGDILLHWTAPSQDATHDPARFFPLYRSADAVGGYSQIGDSTGEYLRDFAAAWPVKGSYFYLVAARNAAGTSGEEP